MWPFEAPLRLEGGLVPRAADKSADYTAILPDKWQMKNVK